MSQEIGLVLGVICNGTVPIKWMMHQQNVHKTLPGGLFWSYIYACGDFSIDKTKTYASLRTNVVNQARNMKAKWLMFVDSDVFLPADAVNRLMSHDVDIVTGVYWMKTQPPQPVIYKTVGDGPIWKIKPQDGLLEIGGAGLGCCLINMKVFDRFAEKGIAFFNQDWTHEIEGRKVQVSIGEDHYFYCFEPGCYVFGEQTKKIEDIQINDKVITHLGRYKRVTDIMSREYKGKLYNIVPYTCWDKTVWCTPEHPYYIRRNNKLQWVSAKDIKKDDFLVISKIKHNASLKILNTDFIFKRFKYIKLSDKKYRFTRTRKTAGFIPQNIKITNDFMKFLGLWLAEGSTKKERFQDVRFSFNATRKDLIEFTANFIEKNFGSRCRILKQKRGAIDVLCYSRGLAELIIYLLKHGARDKELNEEFFSNVQDKHLKYFFQGYWEGDGYENTCCTVSPILGIQLKKYLNRLGILTGYCPKDYTKGGKVTGLSVPTLYHNKFYAEIMKRKTSKYRDGEINRYTDRIDEDKDYFFIRVKDIYIKDYQGKIYNLEIEEDNSYNVNGIVVHNCKAKELGFIIWCDTNVLCDHYDIKTDIFYPGEKVVAEITKKHLIEHGHGDIVKHQERVKNIEIDKPTIVFYNASQVKFDGSSIQSKPISGSETAIINMAKEMKSISWNVHVFCNVETEGYFDEVGYYNYTAINEGMNEIRNRLGHDVNVFISSRDIRPFLGGRPPVKKTALWIHDMPFCPGYDGLIEALPNIDYLLFVSEFQAQEFQKRFNDKLPKEKIIITKNGIDESRFNLDIAKEKGKCIYSTTPFRGLDVLLGVWPRIKEKVPYAKLHIYSGMSIYNQEEYPETKRVFEYGKSIADKYDIIFHEPIKQDELAREIMSSELMLYPNHYPETSCLIGETRIAIPGGTKKINEIKTGDMVYGYSHENKKLVLNKVLRQWKTKSNAKVYKLTYKWGIGKKVKKIGSIEGTGEHLILLKNGEYKRLDELKPKDRLMPFYRNEEEKNLFLLKRRVKGLLVCNEKRKKNIDVTVLKKKYLQECKSMLQIAKELNLSDGVVKKNLQQYDIPIRGRKESQLIRQNHIVKSIEFSGYKDVYDIEVDKVHNFVANEIIVHNCITAMEAIRAKTPIITSRLGALPETIGNNNGIFIDGDAHSDGYGEDFINATVRILTNDIYRKKFCLEYKDMSWKAVAADWNVLFTGNTNVELPYLTTKAGQRNNNTEEYWNYKYQKWKDKGYIVVGGEERDLVLSRLIAQEDSILDIGCGMGDFLKYLYDRKIGRTLNGVDISQFALDETRTKVPIANLLKIGIQPSGINIKDVDVMTAIHLVEHLENPEEYINEWKKSLKRNGEMILVIPLDDEPYHEHLMIYNLGKIEELAKKVSKDYEIKSRNQGWKYNDGRLAKEAIVRLWFD